MKNLFEKLKKGMLFMLLLSISLIVVTSCNSRSRESEEATIYEKVSDYRHEKEQRRIAEVYYNLDEPVLVSILYKIGTNATRAKIVFEYEQNKEYYKGIVEGITNRHLQLDESKLPTYTIDKDKKEDSPIEIKEPPVISEEEKP